MTPADRVRIRVENHVAEVHLNRPEKRNGMDLPMFEALIAAGERLAHDPSVRAVVLTGEGKAFCAGLDWSAFMAEPEMAERLFARAPGSPANAAQRACSVWSELRVPVIAAVQGAAFGAGMQLALACDVRFASHDAQLSLMEIRYGIVPDMTVTQTLPRLVRADVAKDLVFTGRIVEAQEALALGLVTRLSEDPLTDARRWATDVASKSPQAIRVAKKLFDSTPFLSHEEGLALEARVQRTLLGTPNQMEAVRALMEKREAKFADPE